MEKKESGNYQTDVKILEKLKPKNLRLLIMFLNGVNFLNLKVPIAKAFYQEKVKKLPESIPLWYGKHI